MKEFQPPPEILCKIFKHLNLKELIKCKKVNKNWYSIVNDLIKVKRLVVGQGYSYKWYFTNELIKEEIECCHPNLFLTQYKRSFLANLNYLYIDPQLLNFDLNNVNQFTQLIHLETIFGFKSNTIFNLTLPNLQNLSFDTHRSCYLIIECPKLKILCYKNYRSNGNLDIKYPNTIIYLETCLYDEKLMVLKNVEYLITDNYKAIDESTLSNLKEFHFEQNISALFFDLDEELNLSISRFDYIEGCLRRFMSRKRRLKMNSLKTFFLGIQLFNNIDEINFEGLQQRFSRGRNGADPEKFYMNNYNRLKNNLTFICEVDYSRLMAAVNEIPTDFFKKFNNLKNVCSHGTIVNEKHFLSFLKNIKRLSDVDLKEDVSLKVVKSLIGLYSMAPKLNYELSFYKFKFKNISFQIQKKTKK